MTVKIKINYSFKIFVSGLPKHSASYNTARYPEVNFNGISGSENNGDLKVSNGVFIRSINRGSSRCSSKHETGKLKEIIF